MRENKKLKLHQPPLLLEALVKDVMAIHTICLHTAIPVDYTVAQVLLYMDLIDDGVMWPSASASMTMCCCARLTRTEPQS